jgi:CheY-like chemotaxis protein/anti-sigma regulatory factor (Ser/Thr protein kinase)
MDLQTAWVLADAARIEQVVTNLLANAFKYTPPGGQIHVSTAVADGHAVLQIQDSGAGIAPELLPNIFELFVQGERPLDRPQGGLGIGLTLVRRLIAMHQGTVHAASDGPGKGSTFTVRLPALVPPAAAPAPAEAPSVAAGPLRILIVEDVDDTREMLRRLLELSGHEVAEADDGPTAVAQALALAPDAVIVDVGLPGLDGYEVAARIRAGGGRMRLVALTGYGRDENRRRAAAAGFDAHLVKPVDRTRLMLALGQDPSPPRD